MRTLLALSLVAVLAVTSFAEEKPKGKKKGQPQANPMVAKLMTSLKEIGLSDDQMTQVKAAAEKFQSTVKETREAGLSAEVNKKYTTAMKEAREAGLKGKELAAKAKESVSEEEAALMQKVQDATVQMKKAVAGVLTQEQMEALPEAVRKQLQTGPAGKGGPAKGKKKKDAA
ncbi:hypothetical protein [Neorhodopirellula pilleata]|uniref:LTXXQ motif protein n=1 Tax=Neorhodopirellula pilleata TaxID=2714738 RepID=A0A5C5ZVS2_9BACT|nr:hypothetical protein [Neorhodopirellula pilleata]TWT91664.1 hypothetical protein Pla100_50830 [Neorhodopirellula pilleata]